MFDWLLINSDDTCRTVECGGDGTDCDEGHQCIEGGVCRSIYRFWNFLGDGNKWNRTYFCDAFWPRFIEILEFDWWSPLWNGKECWEYMIEYDFDGDGNLNRRELVPLAYDAWEWPALVELRPRGSQINCSECWGIENH